MFRFFRRISKILIEVCVSLVLVKIYLALIQEAMKKADKDSTELFLNPMDLD